MLFYSSIWTLYIKLFDYFSFQERNNLFIHLYFYFALLSLLAVTTTTADDLQNPHEDVNRVHVD